MANALLRAQRAGDMGRWLPGTHRKIAGKAERPGRVVESD